MRVLGIDEAGRGCVLGSLVIAGFLVEDPDDDVLRAAGADDSKKMSVKKRLAAREQLRDLGIADVRAVHPGAIDTGNLNTLEEEVIRDLIRTWQPDRVYVDALGHPSTLPRFVDRLQKSLAPLAVEIIAEPKADSTYPVVGAASIFAKTSRDERLEQLQQRYGTLGSGYPSDPKTRSWLLDWARTRQPWPGFVRTKWATVTELSQQALFSPN